MKVSADQLSAALEAAAHAHHDYQENALGGERDEQWPGWYAAYVLGRLGDFTTPSELSRWLSEANGEDWTAAATSHVRKQLG